MSESENVNEEVPAYKLYSSRAIGLATFLGSPVAAGYLISENFKTQNQTKEARISLIIGALTTILLFVGIFSIPESMIEKFPRQLLPLLYTLAILGIVEWKQGVLLKNHKNNDYPFYSIWRSVVVGIISLAAVFSAIFGYVSLFENNESLELYDDKIVIFTKNESESLVFYDHLETKHRFFLINELKDEIIPMWEENKALILETNRLRGLPKEALDQNKGLLQYCDLRLEAFNLFLKGLEENTDKYDAELEEVHSKMTLYLYNL